LLHAQILEALTTKECQEEFSLESLETLGDSFLKYVAGQHLFSEYDKYREDKLTSMRKELVSNTTLCQMACKNKLVVLKFLPYTSSVLKYLAFRTINLVHFRTKLLALNVIYLRTEVVIFFACIFQLGTEVQ
jgi:dsRNA-specific ribonuclease